MPIRSVFFAGIKFPIRTIFYLFPPAAPKGMGLPPHTPPGKMRLNDKIIIKTTYYY
jgi:hypothetical protein